ncbi:MAG: ABC transporter substrate-binding protein [Polyangiaceae bacterium]|nr:ABC transporter substrate-binding protein [Polyangiaceae bacterium]
MEALGPPWPAAPERIVSLVPSDSYNLVRLGVGARLVGRTRYCVAPEPELRDVPSVGGTKGVDVEAVLDLRPDLVVANREENTRHDVEALARAGVPVLLSLPCTVGAGLEHAARLAALLPERARDNEALLAAAHAVLARLQARPGPAVRTFLPIWAKPLMSVNGATFVSDALALAGGVNVLVDRERRYPLAADLGRAPPRPLDAARGRDVRYPRITLEEVAARRPELVLLPDEPHPFGVADAEHFRALPGPPAILFCDGKDLMWYGLRCLEGLEALAERIAAVRAG